MDSHAQTSAMKQQMVYMRAVHVYAYCIMKAMYFQFKLFQLSFIYIMNLVNSFTKLFF